MNPSSPEESRKERLSQPKISFEQMQRQVSASLAANFAQTKIVSSEPPTEKPAEATCSSPTPRIPHNPMGLVGLIESAAQSESGLYGPDEGRASPSPNRVDFIAGAFGESNGAVPLEDPSPETFRNGRRLNGNVTPYRAGLSIRRGVQIPPQSNCL